jgi:hypothetical protein
VLGGFHAYHLDRNQVVVTSAPAGCERSALTWLPGPLPREWPDRRYLLVYDDVGHEFTSSEGSAMAKELTGFVIDKLKSN